MYLVHSLETMNTYTNIFCSNNQSKMVIEKEFETLWLIQIQNQ